MAGLTTVTSGGISDGTITNADINASAAIDASKVSGLSTDSITEGNTTVEVVDTGSDGHITFDTEGTERARIDSSGKVGIGTTSPNCELHVGNTSANPSIEISRGAVGDEHGYRLFGSDGAGNVALKFLPVDDGSVGSETMRIDDSGRLLIGLSSGANRNFLQIQGDVDNGANGVGGISLRRGVALGSIGDGSTLGQLDFCMSDGGVAARIICDAENSAGTSDYPGRLQFETTANGASSPTERMRIDSDGNVGIGTTTASKQLQVHEGDSTASEVKFSNTTTGTGLTDGFDVGIGSDEQAQLWNNENTYMRFATNNTERMRITNSGNVGIGTTSPDALLDISVTGAANSSTTDTLILNNDNSNSNDNLATRIRFNRSGNNSSYVYTALDSIRTGTHDTDFAISLNNGGTLSEEFRVHSTGGISLNGETTAANVLDDYEEGTFTPTYASGITSPTYASQEGSYVKIGRIVTFGINIRASGGTEISTQRLSIGGLPFASGSPGGTYVQGGAWFTYTSTFIYGSGGPVPTLYVSPGTQTIQFYNDQGTNWNGNSGQGAVGAYIYIRGQYETAA